jgi:hypothetical protein
MQGKREERCTSQFDEHRCKFELGHRGKHRDTGVDHECFVTWTDAGLQRVLADRQKAKVSQK